MTSFEQSLGLDIDLFSGVIIWGLLFTRIMVMLLITPFLGTRAVPGRARMAIAIALSIFAFLSLYPSLKNSFPTDTGILFALFFKEIFFGFTLGFVTVMVFYALESAGRIIDHQRGSANAMVFVPQLGQVTLYGLFNFWLAIAFFLSIGGHRYFLEAFFLSYQTVPVLTLPTIEPGLSPFLEFMVRLSGDVLIIAVQISAPVLIAILLVDIVLGVANKMAPQINVFELGFALKGYIGPVMLYVSLLVLVAQMDVILKGMIKSVYEITALFGR